MRTRVVAWTWFVVIALIPAVASGTDGVVCGTEVTDDITLTHDLVGCPGDGLVAAASGITIDLGGHTISGAVGDAGVRIRAFVHDVTIVNGTITGFSDGVRADISTGNHISMLTVTANTRGINLANVGNSVVEKNTAVDNTFDGIRVNGVGSDGNTVQQNVIVGGGFGITVADGADANLVTRNAVSGTGHGISVFVGALGNTISQNDVTGNAEVGIQIELGSDDAVVARNTVSGNGLGILVKDTVAGATVERNVVDANAGDGIKVSGQDGTVARNDVTGNGGVGIHLTTTSSGNVVSRNDLADNGGGVILDEGTGNVVESFD